MNTIVNAGVNTDVVVGKLRDEIIETEKSRSDLIKWKIILIAATGAAALGVGVELRPDVRAPVALLALVPFLCLYVDAVCFHLDLRILAIAAFLRTRLPEQDPASIYELEITNEREAFDLESVALRYTTLGLCVLLIILGWPGVLNRFMPLVHGQVASNMTAAAPTLISTDFSAEAATPVVTIQYPRAVSVALLAAGVLGLLFEAWLLYRFKRQRKTFDGVQRANVTAAAPTRISANVSTGAVTPVVTIKYPRAVSFALLIGSGLGLLLEAVLLSRLKRQRKTLEKVPRPPSSP